MRVFAFLVVVALIAAASADAKVDRSKAASGLNHHLTKLLANIAKESEEGHAKFKKFVSSCKSKLANHSKIMAYNKKTIGSSLARVASNKITYRNVQSKIIPAFEKEARGLEKKKDELQKEMEEGDAKRKGEYAKYVAGRKHFAKHLAFVRKLYLFIMGSKVEKRRTVLLQQKSREMIAHAKAYPHGRAQAMMEDAASMLATNHLDSLYKLLDNLRGEIQRDMRASKRKELRAANDWVLKHANLRSKQLGYHKDQLKASLHASKAEMKNAKLDWDTEMQQRQIDTLSLKLEHHSRDKDLLALKCRRTVMYYKRKFVDWKDEKIALVKVQAKVRGFYGVTKTARKPKRKKRKSKKSKKKSIKKTIKKLLKKKAFVEEDAGDFVFSELESRRRFR